MVDSGAEESVAPPGVFPGAIMPSAMSRAGKRYRAANGHAIKNLGQQTVRFRIGEGHACAMPMQIAEVERPLIAASQLAGAGNRVIFEKDGGTITSNSTGKEIHMVRKGGVYVLRMLVPISNSASDFPRQGK